MPGKKGGTWSPHKNYTPLPVTFQEPVTVNKFGTHPKKKKTRTEELNHLRALTFIVHVFVVVLGGGAFRDPIGPMILT